MVIWIGTEMRQEILAIHTEVDACNGIQRKLKTLKKEKEDPAPPTVSLKPENTGDKLKRAFEQQNQARLFDDRRPEIIVKVINIVLQVLVCGLLALDVFVHTGLVLGGREGAGGKPSEPCGGEEAVGGRPGAPPAGNRPGDSEECPGIQNKTAADRRAYEKAWGNGRVV